MRTTRRALRRAIKSMTITGYYTTEIGLRQELGDDGRMMLGTFEGARIRNINRGMLQCWFLIADCNSSISSSTFSQTCSLLSHSKPTCFAFSCSRMAFTVAGND